MTRFLLRRAAPAALVIILSCLFCAGRAPAMGNAPKTGPVAFRSLGIWDEKRNLRFDLAVWYPGGAAGAVSSMDGRRFNAGHGRPIPGYYPIILLSHDTAGGRFDSGDLAAALASHGYMVIAPTQPGDNIHDQSKTFSFENLIDRPKLLLLGLEAVLDNPDLGPLADESRIGLVGVGYGAVTVFQLLGAKPDLNLLRGWCPKAEYRDMFCTGWSGARLADAGAAQASRAKNIKLAVDLTPSLTRFAPKLVPAPPKPPDPAPLAAPAAAAAGRIADIAETVESDKNAYALALDFQGGTRFGTFSGARFVLIEPPESSASLPLVARDNTPASPRAKQDTPHAPKVPRRQPETRAIRAAALVAPAGGMLFAPEDLRRIQVPTAVVEAGQDELYSPAAHALPFVDGLPVPAQVLPLPEAGHFSLFAPCDSGKTAELRCDTRPDRERHGLREKRDEHLIAFFLSTLGAAAPPEPPGAFVVADQPAPPAPEIQEKADAPPTPPAKSRRRR